ncbi:DNA helicase [Tanacetum coccineum]
MMGLFRHGLLKNSLYWTYAMNCSTCSAAYKGLHRLEVHLQVFAVAAVAIVTAAKHRDKLEMKAIKDGNHGPTFLQDAEPLGNVTACRMSLRKGKYAIMKGDRDGSDVGSRTILPASFTEGPRYMYSHYLDTLAICRVHENLSFFITFTCNVKPPEIGTFMEAFPEVTIEDRPAVTPENLEAEAERR